jgi:hypothetical protein
MGHYAAEMQCDTCGKLHCVCPPKTEKPNRNFIVTGDFKVVTVAEFDADPANTGTQTRYGRIPMNPIFYRMGKKEFKKRADAEVHARELCEAAVESARAQLTNLKNILKVQRPWEKK